MQTGGGGTHLASGQGYRLGALLGQGGMASVFEATRTWDGTQVALKVLHATTARDRGARRTLINEALACAPLDHPSLVRLLDVDEHPQLGPFLVAELVRGSSLARWLETVSPLVEGLELVARVLDGLAAAHAAGVVHGDLKPANVLVTPQGAPKVCDFGIAQVLGPQKQRRARRIAAGTPHYMAPEQFQEGNDLDPRTDLYAIGVMVREMVSGERLWAAAESHVELLGAKLQPLAPLTADAGGRPLPPALGELVASLLQPSLHDRPRFAATVAAALRALLPGVAGAIEVPSDEVPTLFAPRTGRGTVMLNPKPPVPPPPPSSQGVGRVVPSTHLPGTAFLHVRPPPLAGRKEEIAALEAAIAEVVASRRSMVVLLEGPTGIGKSRLAAHAVAACELSAAMDTTAVRFAAGGGASRTLRGAVAHLFAPAAEDLEDATRITASWLRRGREDEVLLDVEALAAWLAAPEEEDLVDPAAAAALAESALRTLASAARPLCLWLDDLPLARDGSLELAERMADGGGGPILVVATCASDVDDDPVRGPRFAALRARSRVRAVPLGPLPEAQRADLLGSVADLDPRLAAEVAAAIEAPPLFFVQLVQDWVDRGLLELRGDRLAPSRPVEELLRARGPADVVASRVEALLGRGRDEATVLFAIALLGPHCEDEVLRKVAARAGVSDDAVDATIDEALLRGVLLADGTHYALSHALFRAALVRRVEEDALHRPLATACADELSTLASRQPRAAVWVAHLRRRGGAVEAAHEALLAAADVMARGGDYEQAEREVGVARRWLEADGIPADHARTDDVVYADVRVAYFRHEHDRARRLLEPLIPRLRARGDVDRTIAAEWLEANVHYYQGDPDRSAELLGRIRTTHGDRVAPGTPWCPRLLHAEAHVASFRGEHERAAALLAEATEQLAKWPWGRWATFIERAEVCAALGQHDEADRLLAQARATGARGAEQLGLERDTEMRLAVARGVKRDRRILDERVRSHGHVWNRTAALLLLATHDLTFGERTAAASTREALDAFARFPHDEAFSQWCLRRIEEGQRAAGREELAERAASLADWRWGRARRSVPPRA